MLVRPNAAAERIVANAGDTGRESDAGQSGAAGECPFADGGDAKREIDAGQSGAVGEHSGANAGDAGGESHAGQSGAAGERTVADSGDAGGDDVVTNFSHRILDQDGSRSIEQNSRFAAVLQIARIHINRLHPSAAGERMKADTEYAGGDGDAGKSAAAGERSHAD